MTLLIAQAYPWIKSLHVISVILWMGAQFLLPALLAGHRGMRPSAGATEKVLRVEHWLVGRVMNPAMVAAFIFGGILVSVLVETWWLPFWLGLKLGLVFLLAVMHGRLLKEFWRVAEGRGFWEEGRYRRVQGLHLVLLASVVLLVVVKPLH